jgi:hypothetical protein
VRLERATLSGNQSDGDVLSVGVLLLASGAPTLLPVRVALRLEDGGGGGEGAPAPLRGVDYEIVGSGAASLSWAPGESGRRALPLRLLRRPGVASPPKTLRITLAAVANADADGAADAPPQTLLTLRSAEPPPAFAVLAPRAAFRGDAPAAAYLEVAPAPGAASLLPCRIAFNVSGGVGTAVAGQHYVPLWGVLTWQPLDTAPQRIELNVTWANVSSAAALSVGVTLASLDETAATVMMATGADADAAVAPLLWLYGVPRGVCPTGSRLANPPPAPPAPPAPPPANPRAQLSALLAGAAAALPGGADMEESVRAPRCACVVRKEIRTHCRCARAEAGARNLVCVSDCAAQSLCFFFALSCFLPKRS